MAVHYTAYDDLEERNGELIKACERLIFPWRGRIYQVYLGVENSKRLDEAVRPFIEAASDITDKEIQFPKVPGSNPDFFEEHRDYDNVPRPLPKVTAEPKTKANALLTDTPDTFPDGTPIPDAYWEVSKTDSYHHRQLGKERRQRMKAWAEAQGFTFPMAGRVSRDLGNAYARAHPEDVPMPMVNKK